MKKLIAFLVVLLPIFTFTLFSMEEESLPQPRSSELNQKLLKAVGDHKSLAEITTLLAQGADPNANQEYGSKDTALILAILTYNLPVVRLLLEKGADPNKPNRIKNTPLHIAAMIDNTVITELLLRKNVDPNARNYKGNTPLIFAAEFASIPVIQKLLAWGANPDFRNNKGQSARMIALDLMVR